MDRVAITAQEPHWKLIKGQNNSEHD
jgi:hypothetical protein